MTGMVDKYGSRYSGGDAGRPRQQQQGETTGTKKDMGNDKGNGE